MCAGAVLVVAAFLLLCLRLVNSKPLTLNSTSIERVNRSGEECRQGQACQPFLPPPPPMLARGLGFRV